MFTHTCILFSDPPFLVMQQEIVQSATMYMLLAARNIHVMEDSSISNLMV